METIALASRLLSRMTSAGLSLSTAESCTGGQLAAAITAVPGSSAIYIGGVVAYANGVKEALLNVSGDLLAHHGAVSEECAQAMALGCQHGFATDWALSTTGVAGPEGGTPDKPVGLVWFGWARRGGWVRTEQQLFNGDRAQVQQQSVVYSLRVLLELIEQQDSQH